MRRFLLSVLVLGGLVAGPVHAQSAEPSRLDTLFQKLKRERNEIAAERISASIQSEWSRSGSATIDLLMGWAGTAIEKKKFDAALDFLDQVIVLKPDYAEGWNRRATLHYLQGNYSKSMSDIQRTLRLEPRHFGALSGMAAIFEATDSKQKALDAYMRALEIYPMMRSAQSEAGKLADELAGDGI